MNQVFVPNAQPLFFNHAQTPPNVYPNNDVNLSSNMTIMRPPYANGYFEQTAFGLIDFQKKLEQDTIKVFPKPTSAYPNPLMNPLCYFAIQQMPLFSHFVDLFNGFEANPYLDVFHKFAVENSQLMRSLQPVPNHMWENLFRRLRAELYTAKAKLQANCIFLELPFIAQTEPQHLQTQEEAEKESVKVLKKYFQWLHGAKQLSGILSDIQWRSSKGLIIS